MKLRMVFATAFASLFTSAFLSSSPIPDYYSAPGESDVREGSSNQFDRIDPFSGSLNITQTDILLPGNNGLDIEIKRFYRSLSGEPGLLGRSYLSNSRTVLGVGWDVHMGRVWTNNERLGIGCKTHNVSFEKSPVLELNDGSRISLLDAKTGIQSYDLIGKNNWIAKCVSSANGGGLEVLSSQGTIYRFNHWGVVGLGILGNRVQRAYLVTEIEDVYGNIIEVKYADHSGAYTLIESVSSSDGRLATFNYINKTSPDATLSSVVAHGREHSYRYQDIQNSTKKLLVGVKPPMGPSWIFKYKTSSGLGQYSISSAKSPMGLVARYFYGLVDFDGPVFLGSTVVVKKEIKVDNRTDKWNFSYMPASGGRPPLGNYPARFEQDVTTIVSPDECTQYKHIGNQTVTGSTVGTISDNVYLIGTLTEKVVYRGTSCTHPVKTTQYEWSGVEISEQNNVQRRGLTVQTEYTYPVLVKKKEILDGTAYVQEFLDYDEYGNAQTVISDGQRRKVDTIRFFNDPSKWIIGLPKSKSTSSISGKIENIYNNKGKVSRTSEYGVTTQYSYHIDGSLASRTDPVGRVTRFDNYDYGVPTKTTYADLSVTEQSLNSFGDIISVTDQLGRVTGYKYDNLGRVRSIVTPLLGDRNVGIKYKFLPNGMKRTLTRGGFIEEKTYDPSGSLTLTSAGGISLKYKYDSKDRVERAYLPNSSLYSSLEYDSLGRVVVEVLADGSRSTTDHLSGNQMSVTNDLGQVQQFEYSSFGDPNERPLRKITYPNQRTLIIDRDNLNAPVKVRFQAAGVNSERRYAYDSRRYLKREQHPESGDIVYVRNDAGDTLSKKVGAQIPTEFGYDSLGRLKSINYPEGTEDSEISYDLAGNVIEDRKGDALRRYEYNDNNLLTLEELSVSDEEKHLLEYSYNRNDALNKIIYPSGLSVDLKPDVLARPTILGRFVVSTEYFPNGKIKSFTYANGITTSYKQSNSRLWTTGYKAEGLFDWTLNYDALGNLITARDSINSNRNKTLTYDNLNQLSTAKIGNVNHSYRYDSQFNILERGAAGEKTILSYTPTSILRLVRNPAENTVEHDDYGNVSRLGDQEFNFGHDGNLLAVNSGVDFKYDGSGNRYFKEDSNGSTVYLHNKAGQLVAEYKSSSAGSSGVEHFYFNGMRVASVKNCDNSVDTDNDGMSDCFELKFGFDPNDPSDGSNDDDGDGIPNGDEEGVGGDPTDPDGDGDGIPDGGECRVAYRAYNPQSQDTCKDVISKAESNRHVSVICSPRKVDLSKVCSLGVNGNPGSCEDDAVFSVTADNNGFSSVNSVLLCKTRADVMDADGDPDKDGYTNFREAMGNSDPKSKKEIPNGEVFWSQGLGFDNDPNSCCGPQIEPGSNVGRDFDQIAISKDRKHIYAANNKGELFAYFAPLANKGKASFRWKHESGDSCFREPVVYKTVKKKHSVLLGCEGNLHSISSNNELEWKVVSGGVPSVDSNNNVYVVAKVGSDHFLYSYTPMGVKRWEYKSDFMLNPIVTVNEDYNSIILTESLNSSCVNNVLGCSIISVNLEGSKQWEYSNVAAVTQDIKPAFDWYGRIYVTSMNGFITTLNSDGTLAWVNHTDFEIGRYFSEVNIPTPTIDVEGNLYFKAGLSTTLSGKGKKIGESWGRASTNYSNSGLNITTSGKHYAGGSWGVEASRKSSRETWGVETWRTQNKYGSMSSPVADFKGFQIGVLRDSDLLENTSVIGVASNDNRGLLVPSSWPTPGQNYQQTKSLPVCRSKKDSDGDGISNCYEARYGLDPNNGFDASLDLDGDGLSNLEEHGIGTDLRSIDSDGDSVSDLVEDTYGSNPKMNDSLSDLDGDGLSNLVESLLGSSLSNAEPLPGYGSVAWEYNLFLGESGLDTSPIFDPHSGRLVFFHQRSGPYGVFTNRTELTITGQLSHEANTNMESQPFFDVWSRLNIPYVWGQLESTQGSGFRHSFSLNRSLISNIIKTESTLAYVHSSDPGTTVEKLHISNPSGFSSGVDVDLSGESSSRLVLDLSGKIYVPTTGSANSGLISAFNPDGSLEWSQPIRTSSDQAVGLGEGTVLVNSRSATITQTVGLPDSPRLIALNASSGDVDWLVSWAEGTASLVEAPVTDVSGNVYIVKSSGDIESFNNLGERRWVSQITGVPISGFVISDNGHAYLLTERKVLAVNQSDGSLVWEYQLEQSRGRFQGHSPVLISGGQLIVNDVNGVVYSLVIKDGALDESSWPMASGNVRGTYTSIDNAEVSSKLNNSVVSQLSRVLVENEPKIISSLVWNKGDNPGVDLNKSIVSRSVGRKTQDVGAIGVRGIFVQIDKSKYPKATIVVSGVKAESVKQFKKVDVKDIGNGYIRFDDIYSDIDKVEVKVIEENSNNVDALFKFSVVLDVTLINSGVK